MKKHLLFALITAFVITAAYSIIGHGLLVSHHMLARPTDPDYKKAEWSMLILAFASAPFVLVMDFLTLVEVTKGSTEKWILNKYSYDVTNPLKMRFVLFLARYQFFLYLIMLVPFLYTLISGFLSFLMLLGVIFEGPIDWIRWQCFCISLW
jgi:hypothetical protein